MKALDELRLAHAANEPLRAAVISRASDIERRVLDDDAALIEALEDTLAVVMERSRAAIDEVAGVFAEIEAIIGNADRGRTSQATKARQMRSLGRRVRARQLRAEGLSVAGIAQRMANDDKLTEAYPHRTVQRWLESKNPDRTT